MAWEAGFIFPIVNTVSVGVIFIVIATVSITASGSCCGRQKEGHPYGAAYRIKGVLCLGRFLQMSMVGHLRPDFISAKSMGILAFIRRSRNKTLIPGNSVCIILYTECHRCAQYTVKNTGSYAAITCSPTTVGVKVDLQTGRLGPPILFFPSLVRENKFLGHRCDSLNLFMPPPFSLLVNSQDAESISWPDGMLVTACVIRSGAE